jgi:hypothetical protein
MSFLNSLKPVLRGQTDITLRVSRDGDGVRILVIPRLEGIEPETKNDELGTLQAILSQAFGITLPFDADLDVELARNIDGYHAIRQPKLDALDEFRESVKRADAAAAKRKAEQIEADKAKKASGKTPTKAAPAAKPEKAAPTVEPVPDLFSLAASQTPQEATDTPANESSGAEDDTSSDTGTDDATNTTDDNSED